MPYEGGTFSVPCTGGWNANPNHEEVPITDMIDVYNVNHNRGGRELRGGCAKVNTSALISATTQMRGIFQFINEAGTAYILEAADDASYTHIYQDQTTLLKEDLTTAKDCYFESFYNKVYIANATDRPQEWDSSLAYTNDMGCPTKCVAAENGAGNVDIGAHSWKYTFVTASGESTGSPVSNTITIASSTKAIALTAVNAGPTGTTSRKVYRTKAGASTYYLAGTISDNTTTTFADNTADSGLGAAMPTSNLAFMPTDWVGNYPKFFVSHGKGVNKRLWAFGCPSKPNVIYASKSGQADFSDANVITMTIQTGDGLGIVAAVEHGDRLIVFGKRKTYLIEDTALETSNWGYTAAQWSGGCAHQHLVCKTPNDVVVMSEDGEVYSVTATQSNGDYAMASLIRPAHIDKWIEDNADLTQIDEFHMVYDPEVRAIKIFIMQNGDTQIDTALVYFIDKGPQAGWTRHEFQVKHACSCPVRVSQSVWKIYTGGYVGFIYKLESRETTWAARTAAEANTYYGVCCGDDLFVAVSVDGTNEVMTSPDGTTWTARAEAEDNNWQDVCYGNGTYVAVSSDGTNRIMYSTNGTSWTAAAAPTAAVASTWTGVCYSNGKFVAVGGTGTYRVMTSPDGITWTGRTASSQSTWYKICYGNGLFVAVASGGTEYIMTSPDGITWTARTPAENNDFRSVCFGNGIYVALSIDGTYRIQTSSDGVTWTARTAAEANNWAAVCYGNGLFVAVAATGTNRSMVSTNAINWTAVALAAAVVGRAICYGKGIFVMVGTNCAETMLSNFTDAGTVYSSGWELPYLSFGNPRVHKRFDKVWLTLKPYGTGTINAQIYCDSRLLSTSAQTVNITDTPDAFQDVYYDVGDTGRRIKVKIYNSDGGWFLVSQVLLDFMELGAYIT